jgi:hypothetical protein
VKAGQGEKLREIDNFIHHRREAFRILLFHKENLLPQTGA